MLNCWSHYGIHKYLRCNCSIDCWGNYWGIFQSVSEWPLLSLLQFLIWYLVLRLPIKAVQTLITSKLTEGTRGRNLAVLATQLRVLGVSWYQVKSSVLSVGFLSRAEAKTSSVNNYLISGELSPPFETYSIRFGEIWRHGVVISLMVAKLEAGSGESHPSRLQCEFWRGLYTTVPLEFKHSPYKLTLSHPCSQVHTNQIKIGADPRFSTTYKNVCISLQNLTPKMRQG